MLGEVIRRLRLPMALEIIGTSANDEMLVAKMAGDQSSIGKLTTPNDDIQALCDQVCDLVFEIDVQFDLRKLLGKKGQKRHEKVMPDDMRYADAKASPWTFPAS